MFYSGVLRESSVRKDAEFRESASLLQQRKMKQAVQFMHKDSADLLPLDGLKKLGTSKDTQPHNILQRRVLESNLTKFRNNIRGSRNPSSGMPAQCKEGNQLKQECLKRTEEEDMIFVWCKCAGKDLKALIDTGCRYNMISTACLSRLGLKDHVKTEKNDIGNLTLPRSLKVAGYIEHVTVTIGKIQVDCSAVIFEEDTRSFSLGLQTLRSLKCVIDMEKRQLVLWKTEKEEIPFADNQSTMHKDKLLAI
ncbi:nuclear receptor-interacting protein 3 [Protopterus annectens]|uniref:nuclear receptor-interacting protein 3 n=1 Tax=Protopterus annectens TaxID=7888 RepID=UPI001CFC187F|nr:nuclear receptor-interacting protein 3 [Protopterus annectens]